MERGCVARTGRKARAGAEPGILNKGGLGYFILYVRKYIKIYIPSII
jgi:hypothetical protein